MSFVPIYIHLTLTFFVDPQMDLMCAGFFYGLKVSRSLIESRVLLCTCYFGLLLQIIQLYFMEQNLVLVKIFTGVFILKLTHLYCLPWIAQFVVIR